MPRPITEEKLMPDDLSPLKQANFTAALNDFDELLTQSGKAFLLGAGCSKCAGVPLTAELTAKTLESELLNQTTKEILVSIEKLFEGAVGANIEDYLSELVDLVAIAERRGARGATIDTVSLKRSRLLRYKPQRCGGSNQKGDCRGN